MSFILFVIILGLLIFIHELGHFLLAKATGMRVDAFAIGFPPNIWKKKYGETTYKLNLIPFGGYVKILGEDFSEEEDIPAKDKHRSMHAKPWYKQIAVLVAGVVFNFILAWVFLSITFMIGFNIGVDDTSYNPKTMDNLSISVVSVLEESPAAKSNLPVGNKIITIETRTGRDLFNHKDITAPNSQVLENISNGIKSADSITILSESSSGEQTTTKIFPEDITGHGRIAGFTMSYTAFEKHGFFGAIGAGLSSSFNIFGQVTDAITTLIGDSFKGQANLDQLASPVKLVGIIGDASERGVVDLFFLIALISLNLAVLNLVPFPALDGGRILFVLIETIFRTKIKPKVALITNGIGFLLLISFMIFLVVRDIIQII